MLRKLALGAFLSAVLTSTAQAGITYSYVEQDAGTSGGVATVNVYLQEQLTGGSQSLITSQNGLFAAGFAINQMSGDATILNSTINTAALSTVTGAPATP